MLFNKDVLAALNNKLKSKYPSFNIQIFLQMLQSTTRPLGYPPYEKGVNDLYYLELVKKNTTSARANKNSHQLQALMRSTHQIMICFCYLQSTLFAHGVDEELLVLLLRAIDGRINTTDEERCAEKSLFTMLLQRPQEVLKLIASNHESVSFVNMHQLVKEQITAYGKKQLKEVVADAPAHISLVDTVSEVSDVLDVLKSANAGLKHLKPFSTTSARKNCQVIVGSYLLANITDSATQPWIQEATFLRAARTCALSERGKKEVRDYIAQRTSESELCGFFKSYPKETKLSAADKFLKLLNHEREVVVSDPERRALREDTNSRLTDICLRYQNLVRPF